MWMEELENGKYKFFERYTDPLTEKQKRVSVTLNSKSNQAKNQATKLLQEKIDNKVTQRNDSSVRFGEALENWLAHYKKTVKTSSYSTVKTMLSTIDNYVKKDVLIRNIDSFEITRIVETAYYDDNYSLNYVKKIKAIIMSVLKRAYDLGNLNAIPQHRLNLKLRQEKKPDKYLEKDELRKIINQLNSYAKNTRKADMVEFMALTGLRYGELIALMETSVNGDMLTIDGTIDFRSGIYKEPIRTTPKTSKSNRVISLSNRSVEIIEKILFENQHLKTLATYNDQNYLFTNNKGLPIDYRTFAPTLKRAAVNAGVKKDVTSHYLRHTHVSLLAELNVDIKTVMDRIGHADATTTLEIYSHVTNKMKASLVDKINTIEF